MSNFRICGHLLLKATSTYRPEFSMALRVHMIECGHGDTTLIQLDDKWLLVDCNLPSPRSQQAFLAFAESKGIARLDLVVLTHPHRDHFAGMREIIDAFLRPPRSIGYFCDGGIGSKTIFEYLRVRKGGVVASEFRALYDFIYRLMEERKLGYRLANRDTRPFRTSNSVMVPIGPAPIPVALAAKEQLETAGQQEPDNESVNVGSLVFVVGSRAGKRSVLGLVTGDSDGGAINSAFDCLEGYDEGFPRANGKIAFDFAKIPHHGAKISHVHSELPSRLRTPSRSVALLSVGTKYPAHPDRSVLDTYLKLGWRIFSTLKRRAPSAKSYAVAVASRNISSDSRVDRQDITVSWTGNGLRVVPASGQIHQVDLPLYQMAK
ncbi:MAG: MBL fold metallo-hydrolase [Verrucomicrobia bacterium]|nr:MBL fold metallo-hydrolase [Verrucomicrobiota bacterium]